MPEGDTYVERMRLTSLQNNSKAQTARGTGWLSGTLLVLAMHIGMMENQLETTFDFWPKLKLNLTRQDCCPVREPRDGLQLPQIKNPTPQILT